MKLSLFSTLLILASSLLSDNSNAQSPQFRNYEYEEQTLIQGMSHDGKWAVSSVTGNGSTESAGITMTRLINLDTNEEEVISTSKQNEYGTAVTECEASGVTVVGCVDGAPAVRSKATGNVWKSLEVKSPYIYGNAFSLTADGQYAVGVLYFGEGLASMPALWKLNADGGSLVECKGLPVEDMSHADQGQLQFNQISSDGRYILGCMSYSYLPTSEDLGGCFFFVYDREKESYKPIGFTETTTDRWISHAEGMLVIMQAYMSNNGKYVTGSAHMSKDIEGVNDYGDEYKIPFLYDVEKDKFTAYDELMVKDAYGSAVSNDGIVIAVTPEGSPVREWSLRSGKYWFSLADILQQKYNTTFKEKTTYSNTGTVNCISDDGKRLISFPDPYKSYKVDLPVALSEFGNGVRLLGSYTVDPAENAEVSHLKNISVSFGRSISVVGGSNSAMIIDADDNTIYNSVGFTADGTTLKIRFRTGTLNEGENYRLFIPEGTVALSDDATQTNSDIYVSYKGRADEAVKPVSIYPTNGATFSLIDYNTSPVMVTFDTEIALTDTAKAVLFRNDETEPFCSLTMATSDSRLALYPATLQYLYEGSTYRIVISEGAVTDVAGNNPSAAIAIEYAGNYVRQISADDVILFEDNFDSGTGNFLMWCGDQGTPNSEMQDWDFQKGLAWSIVRDDDDTAGDMKATSHSNYSPSTQSDDWLVIPQTYIPDMLCSMNFLSQSYKKDKNDILKVIVWPSENVYNTLTLDVINKMKAEGTVVYEQKQNPGANEGYLTGEFTYNNISLADYAGKNIYIAFVNQNKDQSAIFLDSVQVRHDMHYLTNLIFEESVVNKSEMIIKGSLIGNNADKTYDKVTMQLKNAQGEVVDTYTVSGMNLSKNAQHAFQFAKTLPLTVGIINQFSIFVDVDGEQNSIKASVKDLAFQPVKRIVLEEYTGRACGNCPLGILGMQKLEERYGDNFIAVSAHTYNNDPLSSGLSSYTSSLGIDQLGAPSGIINRIEGCYPATSATINDQNRYFFSNADPDCPEGEDKLWMDYANDEMALPAECGIEIIEAKYDPSTGYASATAEIKYALNAINQSINLFTVLIEDNCVMSQSNYTASVSSPDLGDFGLGGKYGQSTIKDFVHNDVAKNVNGLTINGTGGYIPSTVEAGKVYSANVSIPTPSSVNDWHNCRVVVMMINANTGRVINAARSAYLIDPLGIENVSSYTDTEVVYNLFGQRMGNQAKGLLVRNGRKFIIK